MTTQEKNILIAEFMNKSYTNNLILGKGTYSLLLAYNSSWDWLMPVVEKCMLLIQDTLKELEFEKDIKIYLYIVDISAVYKEVVEFIKWHNENK